VVFAFGGTIGTNGDSDIKIFGTGTITVTISGFTIDGNNRVPTGRSAGILLRNAGGIISGNTVKNMYIDGKQTFGIAAYGDSDVVISGNNVSGYAKVGIAANGDNSTNPNPNAIITGNTVTGPGMDASVTLAPNGIQIGRGATGKIIGNTVSGNGWHGDDWSCSGILVAMSDDVEVTGNTVEENEIGIGSYGEINGTWIHDNIVNGNAYGISIQAGAVDTKVNFNNIVDNQSYGVYNGSTDTLDATNNWWGDASGPYHATLNPNGMGDEVSDGVNFNPWIGAPIDPEETVSEPVDENGGEVISAEDSPTGGAITVTGFGISATLVAAQYASNPGGAHGLQAQGYYDVHLSNATGVSSVTIQFAGLPNTVIYYWDGTAWTACSDQEYIDGAVKVTISIGDTMPGLSYLTGGPFMPATTPSIGGEAFPISPWAANAPLIALCVALAAGAGVFVWRRARA
jgi:nitrous oxidase accessory protein NosD